MTFNPKIRNSLYSNNRQSSVPRNPIWLIWGINYPSRRILMMIYPHQLLVIRNLQKSEKSMRITYPTNLSRLRLISYMFSLHIQNSRNLYRISWRKWQHSMQEVMNRLYCYSNNYKGMRRSLRDYRRIMILRHQVEHQK